MIKKEISIEALITSTSINRGVVHIVLFSLLCLGLDRDYSGGMKRGILVYFFFYLITMFLIYLGMSLSPSLFLFLIITHLFVILDAVRYLKKNRMFRLKNYNKWYIYLLIYFISAFLFNPIIKSNVIGEYVIPTSSMKNTVLVSDCIIAIKSCYRIHVKTTNSYLLKQLTYK